MGAYVFLIVATSIWVAFGLVLATRPIVLDQTWGRVRALPLAAKPFVWIAFLPWLLGLAAWKSNWRTPRARLILVVLIAAVWMLFWASGAAESGRSGAS